MPWYGYQATASPRPYADSVTESIPSPPIQPIPLVAMEDGDSGASYDRLGSLLNADGELLDPEERAEHLGELVVTNSPDNDKIGAGPVMFPGR